MSRVLVVDDEAPLRRAWHRVLLRAGHEVAEAGSCAEAEALLAHERVDVILLDLIMPGGSGHGLLPVIAELDPRPRVAIISGYADAKQCFELQTQGMLVLPKPIEGALLKRLVEQLSRRDDPLVDTYATAMALSSRERQILVLTYRKQSTKQIAEKLRCKEGTLASYWQRIFRKTGCRSKQEVLASIVQHAEKQLVPAPLP